MNALDCISCIPSNAYAGNPLREDRFVLAELFSNNSFQPDSIEIICEIYPQTSLERSADAVVLASNSDFKKDVEGQFAAIGDNYKVIPPSYLVRFKKAVVWNNMIFAMVGERLMPVYEFYRKSDRTEKGASLLGRLAACSKRASLQFDSQDVMFIGSAGSFNYGHWLIDDMPMLAGCSALGANSRELKILMSGYSGEINGVKIDSIDLILSPAKNASVLFLDTNTAYHIDNLYYVTPSSYHPYSKNPTALNFVKAAISEKLYNELPQHSAKKLFVNRKSSSTRNIANNEEVKSYMLARGYEEIFPEELTAKQQLLAFYTASDVVGVMGASMATAFMSPENSHICHLAPSGWLEPFYWDLCSVGRQNYSVIYGDVADGNEPLHSKDFFIDLSYLDQVVRGR
jgi:capsular polysaccharide biosynthesis protein